MNIALDKAR